MLGIRLLHLLSPSNNYTKNHGQFIKFMDLTTLEMILIISTILEFNPLFQAVKSIKNKSVKDVSLLTFLSIVVIGSLWLYYGITISSIPLIIGNIIKLFTGLVVVVIYFKYRGQS